MSTGILVSNTVKNADPTKVGADSFAAHITRLMPNGQAPLFGLTSQLKAETASQTSHGYFYKSMVFPSFTINNGGTAYTDATNTLVVDSTDDIIPGMIFQSSTANPSGGYENVMVTAVSSATELVVVRSSGTIGAHADTVADNAVWYQIGNAQEEGSVRPQSMRLEAVPASNITQIFRNAWDITGTTQATDVIAGDSHISESKQDCSAFHAVDLEKALFFGQKYEGTKNNKPLRMMDGLISIVMQAAPENVHTAGSTTNWTQLENMIDPVFDQITDPKYGNSRIVFCGSGALKVINNIGRKNGEYQLQEGQTTWGLQFNTFKSTRGSFEVIEHPLFNSNSMYAKMAVVLDLVTFNLAYLGGRKTKHQGYDANGNQQTDQGVDATGGVLTTECTCLVKNPKANAIIYNLTAAAVG